MLEEIESTVEIITSSVQVIFFRSYTEIFS